MRECPAITARRARRACVRRDDDPIVWQAMGSNVIDVDGNRFVDLTAGFGVASVGHRHPDVVAAGKAQMDTLLHVMGDAFPDTNRILLLERLASLTGLDRASSRTRIRRGRVARGSPHPEPRTRQGPRVHGRLPWPQLRRCRSRGNGDNFQRPSEPNSATTSSAQSSEESCPS